MHMLMAQIFETNPMEAFSNLHEFIFTVQVDTLIKDKGGYIITMIYRVGVLFQKFPD
jgi:hypothetical protein